MISVITGMKKYKDCPKEYLKNAKSKVILVTGGNSGLGLEFVKNCIKLQVKKLIITCRTKKKAKLLKENLLEEFKDCEVELETIPLDLNDMESVKSFSDSLLKKDERIDIFLWNAGARSQVVKHGQTKQGLEVFSGCNYYSYFYISLILENFIKKNKSRVLFVSSMAQNNFIDMTKFEDVDYCFSEQKEIKNINLYGNSKLKLNVLRKYLYERLDKDEKDQILYLTINPGTCATKKYETDSHSWFFFKFIYNKIMYPYMLHSVNEGVQNYLFAAFAPIEKISNNSFYDNCTLAQDNSFFSIDKNYKDQLSVTFDVFKRLKYKI